MLKIQDTNTFPFDLFPLTVITLSVYLFCLSADLGLGGQQALSAFKLPVDCQVSVPKWGKAIGWGSKDDAMLLAGESMALIGITLLPCPSFRKSLQESFFGLLWQIVNDSFSALEWTPPYDSQACTFTVWGAGTRSRQIRGSTYPPS